MKALYTQTSIISKLKKTFFEVFSDEGSHTKEHLFDLLLSVLCLNGFSSVNYNFELLLFENLETGELYHNGNKKKRILLFRKRTICIIKNV